MSKNLEKFEEIVKLLDKDVPSTQDVADLVAQIIEVVRQAKEFLENQAIKNKQELKKDLNDFVNRLTEQEVQKIAEALDVLERKANEVIKSINKKTEQDLDLITKNLYVELSKLKDLIPKETDFTEIYAKISEVEKKIVPQIEISGEETVNKVNSLPIKPEFQIEKEHIEGLEDMEKDIGILKSRPRERGGTRKVPMIRVEDLASQVDGVATTFRLPRDTVRVHAVWSTQFPVTFSSSDFSLSGNTLTLNVGVIQSGQTLMAMIETLFYA